MNSYPFIKRSELSYEFTTGHGVIYTAIFFDYSSLFSSYPDLSKNIYSFTLDVVKGTITNNGLDDNVGATVVAIFKDFFNSRQNVAIYICDSTDDRHLARKRKFDFLFWKYNDGTIIKDDSIAVIADFEIYNTLLIHKDNKLAVQIIEAFRILNERADK